MKEGLKTPKGEYKRMFKKYLQGPVGRSGGIATWMTLEIFDVMDVNKSRFQITLTCHPKYGTNISTSLMFISQAKLTKKKVIVVSDLKITLLYFSKHADKV